MKKKIQIQIYDPEIKKPPFKFITLKELEADIPEDDGSGTVAVKILRGIALREGYWMRFWSLGRGEDGEPTPDIYAITVRNPNHPYHCTKCGVDVNVGETLCSSCDFDRKVFSAIMNDDMESLL